MANRYQNGPTPPAGFTPAGGVPNRGGVSVTSVPYSFMPQQLPFQSMQSMGQPQQRDLSNHLQGVYQTGAPSSVGHAQMYPGISPYPQQITGQLGSMTAAGQQSWQDEQRRFKDKQLKERDYLMQQQRLRQFGSGGGERLNSDKFIQNMFGSSSEGQQPRSIKRADITNAALPKTTVTTRPHTMATLSVSGLSGSFQASQKARDWSNLEDLQNVFSPPTATTGLPPWCQPGAIVPDLYHQIEHFSTRNGVIDTSVLYPVLVSSGLSRETLGHIWTLANRNTPGLLNRSELYAVLALIALAQNACQITSLDILNTLHVAPIPLFNQIGSPPSAQNVTPTSAPPTVAESWSAGQEAVAVPQDSGEAANDDFDDFQVADTVAPAVTVTASPATTVTPVGVGSRLANHHLAHSPGTQKNSAGQTSTAYPADNITVSGFDLVPDEFTDFHSSSKPEFDVRLPAPATAQPTSAVKDHRRTCSDGAGAITFDRLVPGLLTVSPTVQHFPPVADSYHGGSDDHPSHASDPASNFDRYSVFRTLDDNEDSVVDVGDDFGDFLGGGGGGGGAGAPVVYLPAAVAATVPAYRPAPTGSGNYDFFDPLGSLDDEPTIPVLLSERLATTSGGFDGTLFSRPPPPPSSSSHDLSLVETDVTPDSVPPSSLFVLPPPAAVVAPSSLATPATTSKLMSRVMSQMHGIHLAAEDDDDDDDDFGDFIAPSRQSEAEFGVCSNFPGRAFDAASVDGQSVSSLDLASATSDAHPSGGAPAALVRQGSVPSLDLKVFGSWDQEEGGDGEAEDGYDSHEDTQAPPTHRPVAVNNDYAPRGLEEVRHSPFPNPLSSASMVVVAAQPTPAVDRYSLMRMDAAPTPSDADVHAYEWRRCLDNCYQLIKNALNIFNSVSSSGVSNEVTGSEEGNNYITNIIQVYRISCRISQTTKSSSKKQKLEQVFKDIETEWNKLLSFILGSPNFPCEDYFNFESDVLPPLPDNLSRSCGVCLLNVEYALGSGGSDNCKLSYGGRQYHSTCANFWVNCVDSLLPSLPPLQPHVQPLQPLSAQHHQHRRSHQPNHHHVHHRKQQQRTVT